jgi:hypothetical protein
MGHSAFEARTLHRVGAAVVSLEHAAINQLPQVSTHGLRGDLQLGSERSYLDPTVGPRPHQDLVLTLGTFHSAAPLDSRRELPHSELCLNGQCFGESERRTGNA